VDVTIADLVADVRAATPTHAAQLVAPVRDELAQGLRALAGRAERAVLGALEGRRREVRALRAELSDPQHLLSRARHRLDDLLHRAAATARAVPRSARQRLEALRGRHARQEPRRRVREVLQRMEVATRRLGAWQAAYFRREGLRVERLAARLEPANVAKLLSRGFALVLREGRLMTRSVEADPGDPVRIALAEGWLDAEVRGRDRGEDPLPGRRRPVEGGEKPAPGGSDVDPSSRRG
jgi:exodeoxyribonuclease VII large subunit